MDKRVKKTLDLIRNAFEELIVESDDMNFTVKEIAGKANVNRKTFYLHFNCIEDLYSDLENRLEQQLILMLEERGFFDEKFSLASFLDCFLGIIQSKPDLYEKLLIEDKYKFVFRNLKNKLKENIISRFIEDTHSLEVDMKIEYVFSGLIKLFRVWNSRKDEMSRDKMYEVAYHTVKYGIIDFKSL